MHELTLCIPRDIFTSNSSVTNYLDLVPIPSLPHSIIHKSQQEMCSIPALMSPWRGCVFFGDIDVCLRTGMHGADRGRKRLRTDRKYLKQICDLRTRADPRGARKVIWIISMDANLSLCSDTSQLFDIKNNCKKVSRLIINYNLVSLTLRQLEAGGCRHKGYSVSVSTDKRVGFSTADQSEGCDWSPRSTL